MIQVTLNAEDFKNGLTKELKQAFDQAGYRAANDTMAELKQTAANLLADELGIQKTLAKQRIFIDKATRSHPTATMTFGDKSMPLSRFHPRKIKVMTARGVRYGARVTINGQTYDVPGGFIAKMPSGHKGVFYRKGDARLPIKEATTRGLTAFVTAIAGLAARIEGLAAAFFQKNFDRRFKDASEGKDL